MNKNKNENEAETEARKPHNHFKELTPAQQEEWAKMEAAAAETKRISDIRDSQIFEKIAKTFSIIDNSDGDGESTSTSTSIAQAKEEDESLAAIRLSKEDIDFMFQTMMKESKHDELSIRQTVHGLNSAFTRLPIPHVSTSKESGAGKSYIVNHVADYYPSKYIMRLAAVSEKALFHLDGPMIVPKDEETGEEEGGGEFGFELLDDIISRLETEIEECEEAIKPQIQLKNQGKTYDYNLVKDRNKRIKEIESERKQVERSAQKLIDFDNKILIVQDTPSPPFFNLIMTILSQDTTKDQEYAFTDKSSNGKLFANKNRIRGMPVIMTTQVIDDTNNSRFEEKIRRFIHISPNTSVQKIREANRITAYRLGYLPIEYDKLVVSRDDKAKAKQTIRIIIAKLKQQKKFLPPKDSGIKVPFALTVLESLPVEEGEVWKMTVGERLMKYLSMVTKLNMDCRPKIVDKNTGAFYPIAIFEDLKETMALMERGASKVRPYLQQWYDDIFTKYFADLNGKPKEYRNNSGVVYDQEDIVGLTSQDLGDKSKEVPDIIRKKYLDPLINLGLIQKIPSKKDNRVNIYYPSSSLQSQTDDNNYTSDNDDKRIKVRDASLYPSKNLIVESLIKVIEYDAETPPKNNKNSGYEILDITGYNITPEELADRYFSNPEEYFEKGF